LVATTGFSKAVRSGCRQVVVTAASLAESMEFASELTSVSHSAVKLADWLDACLDLQVVFEWDDLKALMLAV
jgi:hypothetical protein